MSDFRKGLPFTKRVFISEVPGDWVAVQLGYTGERCILDAHTERPTANYLRRWGDPEITWFRCWPCGVCLNAFDLLKETIRRSGFDGDLDAETLRRAEVMFREWQSVGSWEPDEGLFDQGSGSWTDLRAGDPGWEPPATAAEMRQKIQDGQDPERLEEVLQIYRGKRKERTSPPSFDSFDAVPAEFIGDQFGWGADSSDTFLVPLYSDGELISIRYVNARKKWSEAGHPLPAIYGLERLDGETKIVVVEGISDTVRLAWELRDVPDTLVVGLLSASFSEDKVPLEPFSGRQVTILGDGGDAGTAATEKLAGVLSRVASVSVVPLPAGYADVCSYEGDLKALVETAVPRSAPQYPERPELVGAPEKTVPDSTEVELQRIPVGLPPFPMDVFPGLVREALEEIRKGISIPAEFLGGTAISLTASAVGPSRTLRLAQNSVAAPQQSILFSALIGPPGSIKTEPIDQLDPVLKSRNADLKATYEAEVRRYAEAKEAWDTYKKDLRAYTLDQRKQTPSLPKPEEPDKEEPGDEPHQQYAMFTEGTLEGILRRNLYSPRGLIWVSNELMGFFNSLNQYKSGGNDLARVTNAWDGKEVVVLRGGDDESRSFTVEKPFLDILGGLTPADLEEFAGKNNGFFDRWLLYYPDTPRMARFGDADLTVIKRWHEVIAKLYELDHELPIGLWLDDEAQQVHAEWYADLCDEVDAMGETDPRRSYAKFGKLFSRIALVLHMLKWASGELDNSLENVHADTARDAIRIIEYQKAVRVKVYRRLELLCARCGEPPTRNNALAGGVHQAGCMWEEAEPRLAVCPRQGRKGCQGTFRKNRQGRIYCSGYCRRRASEERGGSRSDTSQASNTSEAGATDPDGSDTPDTSGQPPSPS